MKDLWSVFLFCFGIVLSIYLGFWVCCVGGIIDMVNAIKASPASVLGLGIGMLKFCLSGLVGWGTFLVFCGIANEASK